MMPIKSAKAPVAWLGLVLFCSAALAGCGAGDPASQLREKGYANSPQAFLEAAGKGDREAVELFIEAGMDPGVTDEQGANALMYSAKGGHTEVLSLLMETGVDINQEDHQGRTVLDYSSADPSMAAFQLLIRARAVYGKLGEEGGHPEEEGRQPEKPAGHDHQH